ncbi:MAG: type VI secretion system tube protein Hcp [Ectothiorhodospiraceae bacterium]|nr:type VI secretion system tube protein Hcp [Ectothiorhodospiraceae bacterium]MCH8504846.1 type VI secretion system tube protein Hcp [Ectothiorhodospiraceae bacterium]
MSIFLQYDAIQGDATGAEGHEGWIDVEEVHFAGTHRRITSTTGTRVDRESANAEFSEIQIIRRADRASPYLFLKACCGRGGDMLLHLTRTGSGSGEETYVQYVLKDAVISGFKVCASRCLRNRASEQLTVSFTGMEIRYIPGNDDGTPLAPIAVGYDVTTNKVA